MDCPICYAEITSTFFITHCGHSFHIQCVRPWLDSEHTCPSCRQRCYYNMPLHREVSIESFMDSLFDAALNMDLSNLVSSLAEE